MKSNFYAPSYLMTLDETLKDHEPYGILAVSTTGLDDKNCSEHSPTRVVFRQYEFDETTQSYQNTIKFDKMVQAPEEAIKAAEANIDNYDVFTNGGIDREAYKNGENVLSVEEFKKEFSAVIDVARQDKALVIANGLEHSIKYLDKIGCADTLKEMSGEMRALDQSRLTRDYFQKNGIKSKSTLEDLRNSLIPSPKLSFYNDTEKMKDFKKLSKDEFLQAHSAVTAAQYDITAKDAENRSAKIIGGDRRVETINAFVTKHGRDEHFLESAWQTHQRESELAYVSSLSERGKESYKKGSLHEKFGTLIDKGTINPDEILSGKSEFHKLMDAVENGSSKGMVIIHAASTGFEWNAPSPRNTGFPIQFTALVYPRENGIVDFSQKPKGLELTIKAPTKSVLSAEKNITDSKRPYDTFKETGINLEDYKNGIGVTSQDKAIQRINEFFTRFPPEDYPIIAIGGTKGSDYSFTQTCMSNLANFTMCEAEYIDFSQVIKDYAFLAAHDENYPQNVMFGDAEMKDSNFSLQGVASAKSDGLSLNSTTKKCGFTATMIKALEEQQEELFKTDEKTIEEPVQTAFENVTESNEDKNADIQTESASKKEIQSEQTKAVNSNEPVHEEITDAVEDEEMTFADENSEYSNVISIPQAEDKEVSEETEAVAESEKNEESRLQSEVLFENIEEVTAGVGGGLNTSDVKPKAVKEEQVQSQSQTEQTTANQESKPAEINTRRRGRYAERHAERQKSTFETKPEPPKETIDESKTADIKAVNDAVIAPVASDAISKLIDTVTKQSEIVAKQSEIISANSQVQAEQNNNLLKLLQEQMQTQNALIQNVMQMGQQMQAMNEQIQSVQHNPFHEQGNRNSPIERIESIRENLSELYTQLTANKTAQAFLVEANKALSSFQKEIQKEKQGTQSKEQMKTIVDRVS